MTLDLLREMLGMNATQAKVPPPEIAWDAWFGRQPMSRKLKDDSATIKLQAVELKRLMRAAYCAGFERSKRA